MPPRPREGAVVVVDITLVVRPEKGVLETDGNPNPTKQQVITQSVSYR